MNKERFILTKEAGFEVKTENEYAYNRMDHSGYQWWNTWFRKNGTNGFILAETEMDEFSDYIRDEVLPNGREDIAPLMEKMGASSIGFGEYNIYCQGQYCDYWVRLIDRKGDYNVYIHCYAKE